MIQLGAGQFLFREGDAPTSAFLIEEGQVEVVLDCPTGDVVIAVRNAGDIVGEMAIIDRSPRSAGVRAVTDCVFLPVNANSFPTAWPAPIRFCAWC